MRLVLEMSEQQADVMRLAVELWARIGCGELSALLSHPEISRRLTTDQGVTTEEVRRLLESLKTAVFGLSANSYFGIQSREIGDGNRIAFDLMQVIRHHLAWSRAGHPPRAADMYSVAYHDPMLTSSEPLPVVREIPDTPVSFSDQVFEWCKTGQRFIDAGYIARWLRNAVPSTQATLELESDRLTATITVDGRMAEFAIVDKEGRSAMHHQTVGAAFNVSFRQFFHALGIDVSDVKHWKV